MKPNWLIIAGSSLLVASTVAWWLYDQNAGTTVAPRPLPVPEIETAVTPVEPALPETATAVRTGGSGSPGRILQPLTPKH